MASPLRYLTGLLLDDRSTASYGVAHIMAALTVTNRELRDKALAEKDITPEQYKQLQDLQKVKTKDEHGNIIEEKSVRISLIDLFVCILMCVLKDMEDPDTQDMCNRRIQKIAAAEGIQALLR